MEDINTRFILSTEERASCIVSVNLYQNKYWIITKYDTGKSIYELKCDETLDLMYYTGKETQAIATFLFNDKLTLLLIEIPNLQDHS